MELASFGRWPWALIDTSLATIVLSLTTSVLIYDGQIVFDNIYDISKRKIM